MRGGLPFAVKKPRYRQSTLDAMAEALRISRDESVPHYDSLTDLKKALDAE